MQLIRIRIPSKNKIETRLISKEFFLEMRVVEPGTDCWIWQGSKLYRENYGRIFINGRYQRAHRIAYEIWNGPIPDGFLVCHHCDNPPCINPEHLFVGTDLDNVLDASRKGRLRNGLGPGEKSGWHKLNNEKVFAIRAALGRFVDIAKQFGVSYTTIYNIKARETWTHL